MLKTCHRMEWPICNTLMKSKKLLKNHYPLYIPHWKQKSGTGEAGAYIHDLHRQNPVV